MKKRKKIEIEKKKDPRGRKIDPAAARHRLSLRVNDSDLTALDSLCLRTGRDRTTIIREGLQSLIYGPRP